MRIIKITAMLVLVLALAAVLSASGCGSDEPARVVEEFLNSTADQDCEKWVELLSSESLELFGGSREEAVKSCEESVKSLGGENARVEMVNFEALEQEINGDTATVKFSATARIEGVEDEIIEEDTATLIKENGEWKINLL